MLFVRLFDFALVWFCLFRFPLCVWEGLLFVIMALRGLFSYVFWCARRQSESRKSCLFVNRVENRSRVYSVLLNVIVFLVNERNESKTEDVSASKAMIRSMFCIKRIKSRNGSVRFIPHLSKISQSSIYTEKQKKPVCIMLARIYFL